MDARDALRRYLEQRRDSGESELVLDSLSVEEALKLIGARATGTSATTPAARAPAPPRAESADWRDAVRAAGGEPALKKPTSPVAPTAPAAPAPVPAPQPAASGAGRPPASPTPVASGSPLEEVPLGLVVGAASRASNADAIFQLQSLGEVAGMVATCQRCPLYATATNPVPGTGNPDADFMIVGEAPGANEDAQGVPFVGQAGQLLTKIIGAINLTREDVFIANVLKHRPPGNRNPLPDEVAACSPYLVRQIELVRPKVLLALGTFAAQTLLETKLTIGKLRGQVHRYHGVPLIVTYHPAALLRNPAWKRPTWDDVQLARRILDRALATGA